jgi:hypothetical protein
MRKECLQCIDYSKIEHSFYGVGCENEKDCIEDDYCVMFNVKIGKSELDKYINNLKEIK